MGGGATRERGRPARMLSRCVPLSFAPCRWERHGLGRSRVLAPLPVEPGGGDGRGCAKKRPRSRVGSNKAGPSVFVFIRGSSSIAIGSFFFE